MTAIEIIMAARERDYGKGITDGMEIAVRLFLGESVHDSQPCPQPLSPGAEKWARDALARLTESTVGLHEQEQE